MPVPECGHVSAAMGRRGRLHAIISVQTNNLGARLRLRVWLSHCTGRFANYFPRMTSVQPDFQGRLPVPKFRFLVRLSLRFFAVLLGLGLLSYLVFRTGPGVVWHQLQGVGWGLALIITLGGFTQLVRTCAWRQALICDTSRLSWSRSLGAQLASDAMGQLGFAGKLLGEGIRVSLLDSTVPLASAISSCAIDGGMHLLTAATVAVVGIGIALLDFPSSGQWRANALLLAAALVALVVLAAVAIASRWRLMGNAARAIGRLSWLRDWVSEKQSIIDSAEYNLLTFHSEAPAAFWASLSLSLLWHALAVLEVYLVLWFMGARIPVVGAFVFEGLTKVINLIGALNPGNLGTYEAGNMLIAKVFGVTCTTGLTLALCRRVRTVFWAGVGVMCMIVMKRPRGQSKREVKAHERNPILHHAAGCVPAVDYCDRG
jgi:uncharacterized membrane protein YuzA (DUF378 family)